jgi:hypothetical protein
MLHAWRQGGQPDDRRADAPDDGELFSDFPSVAVVESLPVPDDGDVVVDVNWLMVGVNLAFSRRMSRI